MVGGLSDGTHGARGSMSSKVRIYEVAKQLNLDPKQAVTLFQSLGVTDVRNHMSSVDTVTVERVKRHLEKQKTHDVVTEHIRRGAGTVLKRRAVAKPAGDNGPASSSSLSGPVSVAAPPSVADVASTPRLDDVAARREVVPEPPPSRHAQVEKKDDVMTDRESARMLAFVPAEAKSAPAVAKEVPPPPKSERVVPPAPASVKSTRSVAEEAAPVPPAPKSEKAPVVAAPPSEPAPVSVVAAPPSAPHVPTREVAVAPEREGMLAIAPDDLVGDKVVADHQRVLHRGGRDRERLVDERAENDGDQQRLDDHDDRIADLVAPGLLFVFRHGLAHLLPLGSGRDYGSGRLWSTTGRASITTKAWAMPPSSVMVRWICASCPAGTRAASTFAAPLVSFMVGLPEGRLTTPRSRQKTPRLMPVPSALAQASLAANRLA